MRFTIPGIFVVLVCFSGVISCNRVPVGNSEEGARWFGLYRCEGCHGPQGEGGKGPRLRPNSLSFGQVKSKVRKSRSVIMPSYGEDKISDQKIADIYTFLKE